MKTIRIISIAFYLVLTSCSAGLNHKIPDWTLAPPKISPEGLYVTGLGYPCPNERSARESALQGAMSEFLRYTGVEVSSYIKMTAHETAKDNAPGKIEMDNNEAVTLATQGFVQKVRQMQWHMGESETGQIVGYVRILVPGSEVARVEAEQSAMRQAKREPFEKAQHAFIQLIMNHRLTDAAHMIDNLEILAKQAGMRVITREQLLSQIQTGLMIEPFGYVGYNLDNGGKAFLDVRVTHNGGPVVNLPVEVTVPAGLQTKGVTGANGIANIALPRPSRSGTYPLVVRTKIRGVPDLIRTVPFQVSGTKEQLSDGRFHRFIEVQSTGSTSKDFANRYQAEEVAMETARQLAFAKIMQKQQGLTLQTQVEVDGVVMTRNLIRSESAGHVDAQAVEEKIIWENSHPVATVVYRMPL